MIAFLDEAQIEIAAIEFFRELRHGCMRLGAIPVVLRDTLLPELLSGRIRSHEQKERKKPCPNMS